MGPLLDTKTVVPRVRDAMVDRSRLVTQVETGLRQCLVLVSAPAGFGKTTLLSDWAANTALPVAWLTLDEDDVDPVRFLSYLTAALHRIGIARCIDTDLSSDLMPISRVERATIALINAVSRHASEVALVLDDYHAVTSPEVHALVAYLLEHLPTNLHLIIATRADPPLPLARLRGRGHLVELRAADLRFTPAEAIEFLSRTMQIVLSPVDAARLTERTEGWPAGLQMAAVSLAGRRDLSAYVDAFAGSHRYIMDYLIEEVWERQPADIQQFLLQTSILDQLTAPLCATVVPEGGDAQAILVTLERSNLFIVSLDERREWFRYHRLFADLLRQRLRRLHPEQVAQLHRRAAEWYRARGMAAEAIGHALVAERFGWAADVIVEVAELTLQRGEIKTFLGWVEALPEAELAARPSLYAYYAWALFWDGRSVDEIEPWLVRLGPSDVEASGRVAALRALLALYRGAMTEVSRLAQIALSRLASDDGLFRGIASMLDTFVLWDGGDLASGETFLAELAGQSADQGNTMAAVITLSLLGEQHLRGARLDEAQDVFRRAVALAEDGRGGLLPAAGQPLMGLGAVALLRNEIGAARDYLLRGIDVARPAGELVILDGLVHLARTHEALGDPAGAQAALEEAMRIAVRSDATDIDDRMVELAQARFHVRHGNRGAVYRWAETYGLLTPEPGRATEDIGGRMRKYELVVLARLHLAEGRYAAALEALEEAQTLLEARGRTVALIELLVLKASVHERLGGLAEAEDALGRALRLAEPSGCLRIFVEAGDEIAPLLRSLVARGVTPALVMRILGALAGERPPAGAMPSPAVPGVLSVPMPSGRRATPADLVEPLTERETEVLPLLATHLTSTEIAEHLYVATSTARTHIKSIYGKLGVHSRDDAVLRARELGLLKV